MNLEDPVAVSDADEDEVDDESPIFDTLYAWVEAEGMVETSTAQIALRLAGAMDDPATAPGALPGLAKELRSTIEALKAGDERERDLDNFLAGLRAPVRDPSST